MTDAIHPMQIGFVGEISGVDITRSLSRDEVAAIEGGMDRYAVLVSHGQKLTDQQQQAYSRYFGELEHTAGGNITKAQDRRLDPYMADVSNLNKDHKLLARDDRKRMFNLGNRLWHSDRSFRAVPAKYSLLSGRIVVDKGGNTEFADMRAAYDALDNAPKSGIEDLVCEHSLLYSRGTLGFTELTKKERAQMQPVRQRLWCAHIR
jgi:alpha-ketoglutarate-dependent 2,4-dichlorophenoxyacetate dioxygenase